MRIPLTVSHPPPPFLFLIVFDKSNRSFLKIKLNKNTSKIFTRFSFVCLHTCHQISRTSITSKCSLINMSKTEKSVYFFLKWNNVVPRRNCLKNSFKSTLIFSVTSLRGSPSSSDNESYWHQQSNTSSQDHVQNATKNASKINLDLPELSFNEDLKMTVY